MEREHYRAVIDGKIYDTETATHICECGNDYGRSDFKFVDQDLYRTPRGRFFLAGEGGPMSHWCRSVGDGYTGGCGIKQVCPGDARDYMESAGCGQADYERAGLELEDA